MPGAEEMARCPGWSVEEAGEAEVKGSEACVRNETLVEKRQEQTGVRNEQDKPSRAVYLAQTPLRTTEEQQNGPGNPTTQRGTI